MSPGFAARTAPLVAALVADAAPLRLGVAQGQLGARIVDGGIEARGSLEAGRRIAEICMGGIGQVRFQASDRFAPFTTLVEVGASDPVRACLASQYAGWKLASGGFFALGSGPARALAACEPLFAELGISETGGDPVLVLETSAVPPEAVVAEIAAACAADPARVTLILTPTASLAGTVQIVARILEVALHKAHALGFPLSDIWDGRGSAPVPPPIPDFIAAMGRTNDACLYGGEVQLYVGGPAAAARDLAEALPSCASRDHGRPFAEIFAACDCDFYRIDPLLFSPARVTVTAIEHGASFSAGALDPHLVARSFGG
ncbi:methenyltetrahydromethanopterin cyclohydrolase [Aquabacter spiritensis]|uniref:Methenyltetrahydromethanopterin cyclohydrolase n=1 Tax=Aquabacter spiritensis TaxID=933073 RepID=A0A4R3LVW2_9HYPH|nr:methenyltetrahydromethanopterin cyclohydrolase [Aquabacter spiritensis]TCT04714.1 methenyltetrahydromethanopterin cyclohydrolase [Aquabacter spiritensis]